MDQFRGDVRSSEGIWEKLSQIAVMGAAYDSRERQPHPKCLEGTRTVLLNHIYEILDSREQGSRLVWLHGTAGVGKSAVAFTVAERMRGLTVTGQGMKEKRLAGSFFFSRRHTKRCTTGYFFATLVYQLAKNFPSIREEVIRAIREDPSLLDPDASLHDQMEALFLPPLRRLQFRLRDCAPLTFIVDAIDECISETEVADLISLLGKALHQPDLPVIHILLMSRSEAHITEAIQEESVRPLVCEIPVKISGEGVSAVISLDGADVDKDIYIFLKHSFTKLHQRFSDFPLPTSDELARLASRAGRRFVVASTMMKFIDDEFNDPRDRLQLMLELTSALLPGTEVYKLYDCILSTCSNPQRAYQHLSVVAALADPLPISQISGLLGPGEGKDVEIALVQLRSVMEIPTDSSLPVNIYHSSVRDYVSNRSNCSLPQVHNITPPHSLLAHSSFRLMIQNIPETTALLDALSELKKQSRAMQSHDPQCLKDSLSFIVQPPESLQVLIGLLWLRGDRSSDLQSWLGTLDGCAWLQTRGVEDWLQTQGGKDWLPTQGGKDWLQTEGGQTWQQTLIGRTWLMIQSRQHLPFQPIRKWLRTQGGRDYLQTPRGRDWLLTSRGREWLLTPRGREWLQTPGGQEWLQTLVGGEWLRTLVGGEWLQAQRRQTLLETQGKLKWLQSQSRRASLQTPCKLEWLHAQNGPDCLHTQSGRELQIPDGQRGLSWSLIAGDWLQFQPDASGAQEWLQTPNGRDWLQTRSGREWLQTLGGQVWIHSLREQQWLQTPDVREWLQTPRGQEWLQTQSGREWLRSPRGQGWLQTPDMREWLQTPGGQEWLQTNGGREWLQSSHGQEWLRTRRAQEWLQTPGGREWLQTPGGRIWLQTWMGREWMQTQGGREWLQTTGGRGWLQTQSGRDWLWTKNGKDWLQTPHGQAWQLTPAASVWATMDEFSSTLEAIGEYTIVLEWPSMPAFQALQQFKGLPDFLMFPAFLALRRQDHFTSTSPEGCSPPDLDVIHVMGAFLSFADEARKRSRSSSDALKYACHNWAFHLSRAPNPWDDPLSYIFKSFWNRNLLSWLERQWCLKGLRSCLVIISEGQKLANELHLFRAPGPSQTSV